MEEEKWQATAVYNGQDGLQHATQYPYDIIVMDIMLPGLNGFDIVKELRNQKMDIPVLMLSAIEKIEFGDLVLSLSTCELECNGKSIHLAYKEFEIMKLLMYRPKILTSKEELINSVWGNDSEAIDNNVEAYISFLRKKLLFLKSKVTIKVIRKVGYHLEYSDA